MSGTPVEVDRQAAAPDVTDTCRTVGKGYAPIVASGAHAHPEWVHFLQSSCRVVRSFYRKVAAQRSQIQMIERRSVGMKFAFFLLDGRDETADVGMRTRVERST
jgi:hypothetical protein